MVNENNLQSGEPWRLSGRASLVSRTMLFVEASDAKVPVA